MHLHSHNFYQHTKPADFFQQVKIGYTVTHMKLILAPMATLTHEAFRMIVHRFADPDEYFSEMIHAPSYLNGGPFESFYVRSDPSPERMVWQLTGPAAPALAECARRMTSLGGIGVDLNMGCSAPDIVRTGAGAAWLHKDPSEVDTLIRSVRSALDSESAAGGAFLRLSVKLRIGETEDYSRLRDFCRRLIDGGVELITLHPRLRNEKLRGAARWNYVADLARDLPVPVYGNGDISSAADARNRFEQHKPAGIMIGRQALIHPWIFRDYYTPGITGPQYNSGEPVDHQELLVYFLTELKERQPPAFFMSRAVRYIGWYSRNFRFAHHLASRVRNCPDAKSIIDALMRYFDDVPSDRFGG